MRFVVVALVACSSAAKPQPKAPGGDGQPIANATHSCADAALGLENATRGVRDPGRSVFQLLRQHCLDEVWPATNVDCFATMAEGDLGRCSRTLPESMREAIFSALSGNRTDRAGIYVTRARLDQLQVGVPECDRFVHAVSAVMTCEKLAIDDRVQLGNETVDFWSLPTARLSTEDLQRMSGVCGQSLASLEQTAINAGCML